MPINIDGSKGIRQNTTETTQIPVGTTAQRPPDPAAGMIRFNTDTGQVEGYSDVRDLWISIGNLPNVIATGGTVTDITQGGQIFRVHTFTSDGTFEVTRGGEVEYLVVAGGGPGGNAFTNTPRRGGGGGAGGLLTGSVAVSIGANSVTVGDGGTRGPDHDTYGTDGGSSSVFGLTAIGGGNGGGSGTSGRNGRTGGSGGGGGNNDGNSPLGTGGAGTVGQGNAGADARGSDIAGGGGGAGSAGSGTTRGAGLALDFTGTTITYAQGGAAQTVNNVNGASGAANTGNAGDGGSGDTGSTVNAGNGGSGIVIVRYRIG